MQDGNQYGFSFVKGNKERHSVQHFRVTLIKFNSFQVDHSDKVFVFYINF